MRFSIITINYNNRAGLENTIESVLGQTCKDYEYIIIDGGSTDGSREVIARVQDRLAYWCSEPDKGIYNAMNKGIAKAKGEFLNFMNSGDMFYDAHVLEHVESSDLTADIVFGKNPDFQKSILPLKDMVAPELLFCYSTINHQTAFIRRELLSANLYDEHLKILSDWKFFFLSALQGKTFKYIDTVVAIYDTTGVSSHVNAHEDERRKVLEEMLPKTVAQQLMQDSITYHLPIVQNALYLLKNHKKTYLVAHLLVRIITKTIRAIR